MKTEQEDRRSGGDADEAPQRNRAAEAYEAARRRTSAMFDQARERASATYEGAQRIASDAGQGVANRIDASPMSVLAGGLALGVVAAALIPLSRREQELIGPYGRRLADTARDAARAARETGCEKFGELGLSRDGA